MLNTNATMRNLHFYSDYKPTENEKTLLSYKGPINYEVMASINNNVESKFLKTSQIGYKIFSIIVELNQNLMTYSAEKNHFNNETDSVGRIDLIEKTPLQEYRIISHNLIENKDLSKLEERISTIMSLDRKKLRKYKMELRKKADPKSQRAGIGLTQIAILSENPITYQIKKLNNSYSLFTLKIKISTNSN